MCAIDHDGSHQTHTNTIASGPILGIMKNDTVDFYDSVHFSTTL